MTDVEQRQYSVDPFRVHGAFISAEMAEHIETLRGISDLGEFFETVTNFATHACLSDLSLLSDNIDAEKATQVLRNGDYSGVDPQSAQYESLLDASMMKESVGRQLIRRVLEKENSLKLSQAERIVLLGSCDIADHFDRLYWEWR